MENIVNYRKEIDLIDKELIALFEKRMEIAKLVAEYKKENDMKIFNQERELEVIEKCIGGLKNNEYEEYVIEFINCIMDISKKIQFRIIK